MTFLALITVSGLVLLLGCGGDDGGGGPRPVTGVQITPGKTDLELGHTTEITAAVEGGESKDLTWSVNGIENGNEVYGTITQNSPVTYSAPDSIPPDTVVVIGALRRGRDQDGYLPYPSAIQEDLR
jgi:hypothetical protein